MRKALINIMGAVLIGLIMALPFIVEVIKEFK